MLPLLNVKYDVRPYTSFSGEGEIADLNVKFPARILYMATYVTNRKQREAMVYSEKTVIVSIRGRPKPKKSRITLGALNPWIILVRSM